MEYGLRLKQLRKAKGFSMYKLHKESGLSQGHISDLEKCINQPTIETLQRLLTPMGITLAEFFNEDGEVSILSDKEKELVSGFRTLPDDKAELVLQMINALNR
ncbi:MAG: helix-turn-helix domain-containing protein [Ruminococcus sp.]|nr:helix-turn-helix domain-containing protein [Ruminococcus sp.]MBR1750659.1 helix-turn-helix domain-containing protein [Ruminococcus sp.]MBR1753023.1 helix-turn-helix domain-containing protein [Ruminococcus sp.]